MDRFLKSGTVFFNSVGMAALMAMMLLTVADILLRILINRPIQGAYELVECMMIIIVFLGIAYTAINKRHIGVDFVAIRLSHHAQMVLKTATILLSLIISSLIAWQSGAEAIKQMHTGEASSTLHIPVYPFIWVVSIGCILLSLVLLRDLIKSFMDTLKNDFKVKMGLLFCMLIAVLIVSSPLWMAYLSIDLKPIDVGVICVILLIFLLASNMPIGFVLSMLGFIGYAYLRGLPIGLKLLGIVPYSTVSSATMSIIPLFILMGQFTFHSGISSDLFNAAHKWLGHFRGGLAMAATGACGAFAACTGNSITGAVIMGQVAYPEMKKYNYDPKLATGCIAAGGTIGTLIPPSIAFVMYGIMTEQSIGSLFMAGIIPGILEVIVYFTVIYFICRRSPLMGPRGPSTSFIDKIKSLRGVWGMLVLFALIMGGIYSGFITPTEAGAIGAFGAFLIAIIRRKLTRKSFIASLLETGQTSAMFFAIFFGAYIFGYLLSLSRLPISLTGLLMGLEVNRYIILALIFIFYLILGCILDVGAMILITIPIVFPIIVNLGFDPIWFGVFLVRVSEIGLITPPVGMNVFVLSGVVKDVPVMTIFRGIIPFLIGDIFLVILIVAFPQISLFLPTLMG